VQTYHRAWMTRRAGQLDVFCCDDTSQPRSTINFAPGCRSADDAPPSSLTSFRCSTLPVVSISIFRCRDGAPKLKRMMHRGEIFWRSQGAVTAYKPHFGSRRFNPYRWRLRRGLHLVRSPDRHNRCRPFLIDLQRSTRGEQSLYLRDLLLLN
jgi:hypothetical protein